MWYVYEKVRKKNVVRIVYVALIQQPYLKALVYSSILLCCMNN